MNYLHKLGTAIALVPLCFSVTLAQGQIPLNGFENLISLTAKENNNTNTNTKKKRQRPNYASLGMPPSKGAGLRHSLDSDETAIERLGIPSAKGGGSCNSSAAPNDQILVLVPQEVDLSRTTSEYPTFWVYLPKDVKSVKLVLQEDLLVTNKEIYRQEYPVTQTPGIVGLTISATKASDPLTVGKTYSWYITAVCNNDKTISRMEGKIERVALNTANPDYNYYTDSNNLIWFEPLTDVIEGLRKTPQNPQLQEQWRELLSFQGVGLESLVETPVVDCCKVP